jgi:hypothetical protein
MGKERKLYPEDQARVDAYLHEGYNSVERKPFRPLRLFVMLIVVVTSFSALCLVITRLAGVH